MRSLLALLLLAFAATSYGQQLDSRKKIQKGIKLFDNKQYDQAADEFLKVPMTDTNYILAQYELALTFSRDSTKHLEALKVIDATKKIPFNMYELSLQMLEGSVLDELGEHQKAHKVYDAVLKKYPEYPQAYYEKAIVFFLAKDYENANVYLKKSLIRNPYHFRSHFYLGKSYYMQGRIAESMVATHFAMMSSANQQQSGTAVQQLSFLSKGSDTLINRSKAMQAKYKDDAFAEMTEVLLSRVSTDKKYQLKTSIDDIITRQLQVIYEMAEYKPGSDRFVNQYYLPFMQKVWTSDRFDEFMLYLFSDLGLKFIDKKAKKNKKGIGKVKEDIREYFSKISATRELNFQSRNSMKNKYLADGQELLVASNELKTVGKEEKYVFSGPFKYYKNGSLRSEGNYNNNNKKVGLWKYYNSLGILVEEENYKDGKLAGWEKVYNAFGVPVSNQYYSEEERVTKLIEYDEGVLSLQVVETRKNQPLELTIYNPNGKVRANYNVLDSEPVDGEIKYYYDNGNVSSTLNYRNKKLEGAANYVYKNRARQSVENYKNGKLSGLCKYYFTNGNIKSEFNYENGKLAGPFKKYYLNGNLKMEGDHKNGKFHGEIKNYTYDAKLMSTIQYKNGLVVGSKYESKKNARYNNTPKSKERFFFSDGNIASDLKNNSKGILDGISNYFYYSGQKKESLLFRDGKKQGTSTYFYQNGAKRSVRNFKDDSFHGPYIAYELNGDSSNSGMYVDDNLEGPWKEFSQGRLESIETYRKGKMDGPTLYYYLEDKTLYKSKWYKGGILIGMVEYDKDGAVTHSTSYEGGNGTYSTHYSNGNEDYKVGLKNGKFHGKAVKKYFDGKIRRIEEFRDGKLVGEKLLKYYNGTKRDFYRYSNSGDIKLYEDYSINGYLDRKYTYSDTPDYYLTEYFIANNAYRQFSTRENETTGPEYYYGPNKEIAGVINYHMGKILSYSYLDKSGKYIEPISLDGAKGKVEMHYQNGQKSVEFTLNGGYLEGKYTYYYPDGKLGKEKEYKNQIQVGASKEYAPNGQLIYSINYNDKGYQHGEYQVLDENGKLIFKANYKNGLPVGVGEMLNLSTGKMMKLTFENNWIVDVK